MSAITGLHAVRRGWLDSVMTCGLQRGSSAWFEVPNDVPQSDTHATVAAAVYLSLGRNRPERLVAARRFAEWFEKEPQALPAFVMFDVPHPATQTKCYLWRPEPGRVASHPYTKVDLVGPPQWDNARFSASTAVMIRRAEHLADRDRPSNSDASWLTHLRPISGASEPEAPCHLTKLAAFCWHLGHEMWTRHERSGHDDAP